MGLTAAVAEQAIFDSQVALSSSQTLAGSEKIVADVAIPENSTEYEVSVGISDTAQIKYAALKNAGTVDLICRLNTAEGGLPISLKAGECMALAGPGVAKAVLDALATTDSLASVFVSNADMVVAGRLQMAFFIDAPVP